MTTEQKLDQISEFDAQRVLLNQDYANKVAEIMLPVQAQIDALMASVQPALNDLDAEYKPKMTAIDVNKASLEAEVRSETISAGKTVKGQYIQCVYSSPRVTWDSKQLDGLMIVLPQLAQARKVGEPSTSFRAVGK